MKLVHTDASLLLVLISIKTEMDENLLHVWVILWNVIYVCSKEMLCT